MDCRHWLYLSMHQNDFHLGNLAQSAWNMHGTVLDSQCKHESLLRLSGLLSHIPTTTYPNVQRYMINSHCPAYPYLVYCIIVPSYKTHVDHNNTHVSVFFLRNEWGRLNNCVDWYHVTLIGRLFRFFIPSLIFFLYRRKMEIKLINICDENTASYESTVLIAINLPVRNNTWKQI